MPRSVHRPSVAGLEPRSLAALRAVCQRLGAAGHRTWLVGGAVRDLALGETPKDLDLASAARPEQVEALFERTLGVGREFGTVLVLEGGHEFQHTTFRSDVGHADARHPDEVRFGGTLEGDAARRDFTANALYLDPLEDEVRDPEGGLEDLRRGRLRCVGEPAARFREDGLRLVRMARFAARMGVEVDPAVARAARAEAEVLGRVSIERCLSELQRIFTGPRCAQAVRLLVDCRLLEQFLSPVDWAADPEGARAARRLARLEALSAAGPPGLALGLALLLEPEGATREAFEAAAAGLERLRVTKADRRAIHELWKVAHELETLLGGGVFPRAQRIRLVRSPAFAGALELARTARVADGLGPDLALEELASFEAALAPEERSPAPLVTPEDFAQAGVQRGPHYALLLEEQERHQLDGDLTDRGAALEWLHRRAAELAE